MLYIRPLIQFWASSKTPINGSCNADAFIHYLYNGKYFIILNFFLNPINMKRIFTTEVFALTRGSNYQVVTACSGYIITTPSFKPSLCRRSPRRSDGLTPLLPSSYSLSHSSKSVQLGYFFLSRGKKMYFISSHCKIEEMQTVKEKERDCEYEYIGEYDLL